MQQLNINPELQRLIPPLTPEEFSQLTANILAEGIREPIITWNGIIVDGHNRYQIAQEHGLEFDTSEMYFKSLDDCKEWMILNQFGRRNLRNYERAILALKLENIYAAKAKERQRGGYGGHLLPHICAEANPIETRQELAKLANVSHGTIDKVKFIEANASDEVKEQLRRGEVSINQAHNDIKKEEKETKKNEERKKLADEGAKKEIEIDFRLGDFEQVFSDIPDGSVDCIITDPPYPYQYIECWSKLSRFAKRVLKPHGYCIAYSGQMHLPEVMARMKEHLDYYWTFAVYHEGQTQIVNGVNLICRWKPVLIFQNGKKKIENTFQDYFISEQREKSGHDWQQSKSGVAYLVDMFTNPNDLILEPFAGSGTTLIVAKQKGRRVIGAEIDEQTYNIAKAIL